jgi:hypothetical protein
MTKQAFVIVALLWQELKWVGPLGCEGRPSIPGTTCAQAAQKRRRGTRRPAPRPGRCRTRCGDHVGRVVDRGRRNSSTNGGNRPSSSKSFSTSTNPSLVGPDFVRDQVPVAARRRPARHHVLWRPLPAHERSHPSADYSFGLTNRPDAKQQESGRERRVLCPWLRDRRTGPGQRNERPQKPWAASAGRVWAKRADALEVAAATP